MPTILSTPHTPWSRILLLTALILTPPNGTAQENAEFSAPTAAPTAVAELSADSLLLVRVETPADGGAAGLAEVEVHFKEGVGYTVQVRDISPEGVKGVQLPEAEITLQPGCIRWEASHNFSSLLPRTQTAEGRYLFTIPEHAAHATHSLLLRTAGGISVYPLRIARTDITLRPQYPTSAADSVRTPTLTILRLRPCAHDCILRLRPEIPVPFGRAPILIEAYRNGALCNIYVSSPQPDAAYKIAGFECRQAAASTLNGTAQITGTAGADERGRGIYTISATPDSSNPTAAAPNHATVITTFTLTDEWNNIICTLAFPLSLPCTNEQTFYLQTGPKPAFRTDSPPEQPAE